MASSIRQTVKILFDSLKPVQQEMFRRAFTFSGRKYVIHSSRRLGKSYFLCVLALVTCLSKANAQVRYASTTQKSVKKIIIPIMKQLSLLLPRVHRPRWNSQEGAYIFKNGSMLHVAGVDNGNADSLRGTDSHLAIVDEAGFVDGLTYLVESVLMPQLMNVNGKLILSSSSPISPAHEFTEFIHEAKRNDAYSSYTIHDGQYEKSLVEEFCKEAGGPQSTSWRREYLNELIVDEQLSIVPEFNEALHVKEFGRNALYNYLHKYEAWDIGVRDNTCVLFAHYDFPAGKLKVEHEFVVNGQDSLTRNISNNIDRIEKELGWTETPYKRIADSNNLNVLLDMGTEFNKHFQATSKDSLAAMINEVRLWVQDGRIEIHPRCKDLIGCLKYGVYQDQKRDKFGRSKVYGHFDSLAALTYLVRNIDTYTNPIPRTFNTSVFTHFTPHAEEQSQTAEAFRKIFNVRSHGR